LVSFDNNTGKDPALNPSGIERADLVNLRFGSDEEKQQVRSKLMGIFEDCRDRKDSALLAETLYSLSHYGGFASSFVPKVERGDIIKAQINHIADSISFNNGEVSVRVQWVNDEELLRTTCGQVMGCAMQTLSQFHDKREVMEDLLPPWLEMSHVELKSQKEFKDFVHPERGLAGSATEASHSTAGIRLDSRALEVVDFGRDTGDEVLIEPNASRLHFIPADIEAHLRQQALIEEAGAIFRAQPMLATDLYFAISKRDLEEVAKLIAENPILRKDSSGAPLRISLEDMEITEEGILRPRSTALDFARPSTAEAEKVAGNNYYVIELASCVAQLAPETE